MTNKYDLEHTGERFLPWTIDDDYMTGYEHIHRYLFATRYADGKRILDIACGEGYGTTMLAQSARLVVGADIHHPALRHAQRYYNAANIAFVEVDAQCLCFGAKSFDLVVSFETLEHFRAQEAFITAVRSMLTDDGILIISTPNAQVYNQGSSHHNPFHERELSQQEFRNLLQGHFSYVHMLGQVISVGSLITPTNREGFLKNSTSLDAIAMKVDPSELPYSLSVSNSGLARYNVAICSNREVTVPPGSIMLDRDHSILGNLQRYRVEAARLSTENAQITLHARDVGKENCALRQTIEQQMEHIDAVSEQIEASVAHEYDLRELLTSVNEQLMERDNFIQESESSSSYKISQMAEYIADLKGTLISKDNTIREMQTYIASLNDALHQKDQYARRTEEYIADLLRRLALQDDVIAQQEKRIAEASTPLLREEY